MFTSRQILYPRYLPSSLIFMLYRCIIIRIDGAVSFGCGFLCDDGDNGSGGLDLGLCSSVSCRSPKLFELALTSSSRGLLAVFFLETVTLLTLWSTEGLTSFKSSTSTGITALGIDSPLRTTGENIFLVVLTITSGDPLLGSGAFNFKTKT